MEIKFNNVHFSYNKNTSFEKKILKEINLTIQKNKINAIIGSSGSGKTTLIELITSLIKPTNGSIMIDNYKKVINISKLRSSIGLIFEFPEEQFFNSTVRKEIGFALKSFNYKLDEFDKRISDSLKLVGLDDTYLERNPFLLSNGEMRKVAIASILVFNPKVVIFDEPTIGLDSASKENLIRLIKILKNKYKKTIIIVSQDVEFLHKFVDYIFVLYNKTIILEGNKYDVFTKIDLLKKYGLGVPKVIDFSHRVFIKKNIKMGYRDEINDLLKDIYRYAE